MLILALALALALVLAMAGVVAAVALPSADITITPVLEAVPPVSVTVRADTNATAVDPAGLVIPATSLDIPLTVQGEFPATGVSVQQTPATGSVTFDSINTVNAMPIPRGTRVSTSDGITFATTDSVTVPRATVPGGGSTITHGTASVGVIAVSSGPKGNVPAGAIDQVPSSLAAMQISVSNRSPTTGGTRTELPKIAAADVTAATAKLAKDLEGSLATALADPSLAPQGATLFPDTARLGAPTFTPDTAGLVGKVLKAGQATFSLKGDATATVTAVDETPLRGMGEAAIRAAVTPGDQIVEASIQVSVGQGTVGEDGTVSYPVSATALQHRPLDAGALKSSVLGKNEADATAALSSYGRVSIALWPFWVTGVPTSPERVTLSIQTPVAPEPTPTPPATPTPRPTKAAATARPSPSGASPSGSSGAVPSGSPVPSG